MYFMDIGYEYQAVEVRYSLIPYAVTQFLRILT